MNLAVKIYNKYGQEVYGILKENPYRLADDIEGVGFRTADDIAAKAGIRTDSDFRVRSVYCIHCFRRPVRGIPFCHRRN